MHWRARAPLNPAGGPPSTVTNYDTQGNPLYAVPPPGAVVTGRDASGNPIYSNPSAAIPASGYSAGTGAQIIGYDAFGNAIYGAPGTAIAQPATSAAGTTSVSVAPASTTDYSTILDWFSEQTLITGVPNWGIVAALGLAYVWFQNRGRR